MIGRGTRQVSSLSPILVNIYVNEGIRVGGHLIKTVRFADDQATLASSLKGLQLMMNKMQEGAGEYVMKIRDMSRIDLVNKNLLANVFRNCRKRNNSEKNYVRKSLTNIAKIARITNLTRIKT